MNSKKLSQILMSLANSLKHSKPLGLDTRFLENLGREEEVMVYACGILQDLSILGVCQLGDDMFNFSGHIFYKRAQIFMDPPPTGKELVRSITRKENPNHDKIGDGSPEVIQRAANLVVEAHELGVLSLKDRRYNEHFELIAHDS